MIGRWRFTKSETLGRCISLCARICASFEHLSVAFISEGGFSKHWCYNMNKTTILAATFAASVSAAQADNYDGSSQYNYEQERDSIIGASIGGGVLFAESEQPYAVGALGVDVGCSSFAGVQLMYLSDEGSIPFGASVIDLDVDILTVGAVWRGYTEVANNGGFYYSLSVGVANYDLDGRDRASGTSGSDSSTGFYVDGAAGFQQYFTENVAFNLGVRLLHLDDVDFQDQGVRIETDFDAVYVGVEAGLVFRF